MDTSAPTSIKRPVGVTVLGIVGIVCGAYGVMAGALFLIGDAVHGSPSNGSLSGLNVRPWMLDHGVVALVTLLSGIWIALGIGLLKLRNWARVGVIIYSGALFAAWVLATRAKLINRDSTLPLLAAAFMMVYMRLPNVAEAFAARHAPRTATQSLPPTDEVAR
jgi:hypothetical protein